MFENYSHIYFLGIGGIGMSALAEYFYSKGFIVSGYDKTPSKITDNLIQKGINIHFNENIQLLADNIDLVIYTPAIPDDNIELNYFKNKNIKIIKRSEALSTLTKNNFTVAVAGTHGKTSITAIIAHIANFAGKKINAFIGGISKNFSSNLIVTDSDPEIFIVEADEFDHSFLYLEPDIAVISYIDPDHLDIYGNYDELNRNFSLFTDKIKNNGFLIYKNEIKININPNINAYKYAINDNYEIFDFAAYNIVLKNKKFFFNLKLQNEFIENVYCGTPGFHNIENSVAASAVSYKLGIKPDTIKSALAEYKGVERRFDFRINTPELVYVDDYAHHPREIKTCISSLKQLYPDKQLTVIFQPHLFSRTRDLLDDFASSLQIADKVILLDIYPAREKPIPGIDSNLLLSKINNKNKILLTKNELIDFLKTNPPELLVTMGAGDIDRLVKPIETALKEIIA